MNPPAISVMLFRSWLTRAKREEAKQKRLKQMLEELESGKLYMNMKWKKR